jgi:hypothetical protein
MPKKPTIEQLLADYAAQNTEVLRILTNNVGEYDARMRELIVNQTRATTSMEEHIRADAKAFGVIADQVIEINKDLKTVLNLRSFGLGIWKAVGVIATAAGVVATLWLGYHQLNIQTQQTSHENRLERLEQNPMPPAPR